MGVGLSNKFPIFFTSSIGGKRTPFYKNWTIYVTPRVSMLWPPLLLLLCIPKRFPCYTCILRSPPLRFPVASIHTRQSPPNTTTQTNVSRQARPSVRHACIQRKNPSPPPFSLGRAAEEGTLGGGDVLPAQRLGQLPCGCVVVWFRWLVCWLDGQAGGVNHTMYIVISAQYKRICAYRRP